MVHLWLIGVRLGAGTVRSSVVPGRLEACRRCDEFALMIMNCVLK